MEIIDYLRIARRRLWILILIPLLAAAGAVALVLLTPASYSATATLSSTALVGGTSNQFSGPQAASSFAAAYTSSATGPAVLSAASDDTGVSASDLARGFTVAQNGASSDMTLTYVSDDPEEIVPALRSLNDATLNSMFGLRAQLGKSQVSDAQAAVAAANQRLIKFRKKYGTQDPLTVYQSQLSAIAVGDLTSAQGAYQAAKSQLDAAQADDLLYIGGVHSVSRTEALFRTVLPVVGAAIFLSVILVMMLELLSNARRPSEQTQPVRRVGSGDEYRATGSSTAAVLPGE